MKPYQLHHGDCLEVLATMADNSVDAVVTDPPYGLSFMGKRWDHGVPGEAFWVEALRVAKPGAHLLAFGGTRTYHRLACAIEDAGWEIRDCVMWVYGSGFPKSLDVSKAIYKAAGAEREVIRRSENGIAGGTGKHAGQDAAYGFAGEFNITAPATEAARQWQGWGTALKPAWEPIIMARKPLAGTVAENVLRWRTGGINVDGCRVTSDDWKAEDVLAKYRGSNVGKNLSVTGAFGVGDIVCTNPESTIKGRWPANVIHNGSDEVVGLFPETTSGSKRLSAARFFYCTKASKADRDEGCEGLECNRNGHPTVKPTALMRYLCRLVTPPGGMVLDPFMGSGSTGKAAILEGFRFTGIEQEPEYLEIARARIAHVTPLLHWAH